MAQTKIPKTYKMKFGDRVKCVAGYEYRNGRAEQTGIITGLIISWDDNSGSEKINPRDFRVTRRKYTGRWGRSFK